jgi:hypothetical protein
LCFFPSFAKSHSFTAMAMQKLPLPLVLVGEKEVIEDGVMAI